MGGKGKESSSSSRRVWSDWSYDKKSRQYFRTSIDKKGKSLYDWAVDPNTIATGNEDYAYDYADDDGAEGMGAAPAADAEYYDNHPRSLRHQRHDDTEVDGLTDAMGAHSLSRSPEDDGAVEYTHLAQGSNYRSYDDSEAGPSDTTRGYGRSSAWAGQVDPNDYDEREYDDPDYYEENMADEYYDDGTEAYHPLQSGTGHDYDDPAATYYPNRSNQDRMLDARFQVHHSRDFTAGSIIKIWWSEGKGKTVTSKSFPIDELVHSRPRRFLVVRPPADGTSFIVPISTYNDRGCTKSGSKARNHGIIYDAKKQPMLLEGEPKLGYQPIRAHMSEPSETLTSSSRIDYSRLQSIQHNQPVWFLGQVDDYDFDHVVYPALEDMWQRRRHGSGGGSSRKTRHSHHSDRKDDRDRKHRSSRRK